jgi:glycine hydroxymethyltransferase
LYNFLEFIINLDYTLDRVKFNLEELIMYKKTMSISEFDQELWQAMSQEKSRQEDHLELIASENYVSLRVLEAQGSVLTNKYAEGYPDKRYYGGCQYVDIVETLAIERAKKLFNADYANVQPHSGSSANAAVYMALLNPRDTLLGLSLDCGGHLTHGFKVNFSGKIYNSFQYGVNSETGEINYQQVAELAHKHKPKLIVAGFSAYSLKIDWQKFRDIADEAGAYLMADMAHVAGLVAAGLYPSPVQIADVTTSTTHKTLRGPRSGLILAKANPELEKKLNAAVFPGLQGGPLEHIIAAKAVTFLEAMQPEFKIYQQQVINNAKTMVKVVLERGYQVVGDKTENHMFLLSLIDKNVTGKDAEAILENANITLNKNTIPNDPRSPFVTSGLRVGTPAITTRGFKEPQAELVANWLCDALDEIGNPKIILKIKQAVEQICDKFPVYEP